MELHNGRSTITARTNYESNRMEIGLFILIPPLANLLAETLATRLFPTVRLKLRNINGNVFVVQRHYMRRTSTHISLYQTLFNWSNYTEIPDLPLEHLHTIFLLLLYHSPTLD